MRAAAWSLSTRGGRCTSAFVHYSVCKAQLCVCVCICESLGVCVCVGGGPSGGHDAFHFQFPVRNGVWLRACVRVHTVYVFVLHVKREKRSAGRGRGAGGVEADGAEGRRLMQQQSAPQRKRETSVRVGERRGGWRCEGCSRVCERSHSGRVCDSKRRLSAGTKMVDQFLHSSISGWGMSDGRLHGMLCAVA